MAVGSAFCQLRGRLSSMSDMGYLKPESRLPLKISSYDYVHLMDDRKMKVEVGMERRFGLAVGGEPEFSLTLREVLSFRTLGYYERFRDGLLTCRDFERSLGGPTVYIKNMNQRFRADPEGVGALLIEAERGQNYTAELRVRLPEPMIRREALGSFRPYEGSGGSLETVHRESSVGLSEPKLILNWTLGTKYLI